MIHVLDTPAPMCILALVVCVIVVAYIDKTVSACSNTCVVQVRNITNQYVDMN